MGEGVSGGGGVGCNYISLIHWGGRDSYFKQHYPNAHSKVTVLHICHVGFVPSAALSNVSRVEGFGPSWRDE